MTLKVGKSCLSSCSYIKPQLLSWWHCPICVVYHLVPTSNHNMEFSNVGVTEVVYHLVPTSNHNYSSTSDWLSRVVYHLVPTSNHNLSNGIAKISMLFIILFLHQTTTSFYLRQLICSCLSSCSYIKPQPIAVNLLVISKILRFELIRNGRAGRFLLQIY